MRSHWVAVQRSIDDHLDWECRRLPAIGILAVEHARANGNRNECPEGIAKNGKWCSNSNFAGHARALAEMLMSVCGLKANGLKKPMLDACKWLPLL